jgi:hypothetical protein
MELADRILAAFDPQDALTIDQVRDRLLSRGVVSNAMLHLRCDGLLTSARHPTERGRLVYRLVPSRVKAPDIEAQDVPAVLTREAHRVVER